MTTDLSLCFAVRMLSFTTLGYHVQQAIDYLSNHRTSATFDHTVPGIPVTISAQGPQANIGIVIRNVILRCYLNQLDA